MVMQNDCSYRHEFLIDNLASPGRKIALMTDPSHLIKKLRNSHMSRKRALLKNDYQIRYDRFCPVYPIMGIRFTFSWRHVAAVRDWQQQRKKRAIRVDRELTEKHVRMQSFGQMNVQRAVDVFSVPVASVMELINPHGTIGISPSLYMVVIARFSGTRDFMEKCRSIWQCMNTKRRAFTFEDTDHTRTELLRVGQYFDDWKTEIEAAIVEESKWAECESQKQALRKRFFLRFVTMQCYEDLTVLCKGMPQFLDYLFDQFRGAPAVFIPKRYSQDRLERDFSILRSKAGGTLNPTVYCLAYTLKCLNMNRLASLTTYVE